MVLPPAQEKAEGWPAFWANSLEVMYYPERSCIYGNPTNNITRCAHVFVVPSLQY